MHYHDSSDARFSQDFRRASPKAVDAFANLDAALFEDDEGLDKRTKELLAIAVAATTQCPYCMDAHVTAAKKAGASKEQVATAVMVAAALRAGGSYTHGWMALKLFNERP